jgi:hypothetical protein
MIQITLSLKGNTKEDILKGIQEAVKEIESEFPGSHLIRQKDGDKTTVEGDLMFTDFEEAKKEYEEQAGYELSEKQVRFCVEAEEQGCDIDFNYSGRGMFGRKCPAVITDEDTEFNPTMRVQRDSMGTGAVIYISR